MKRIVSAFCAAVMMCLMITSAFAVETTQEVIDLGDGYTAVVTTTVNRMGRAANTVSGSKDASIYAESTKIGTMTVSGRFSYTGTSATALSGSITGSGMNGWSYKSGSTSCSGNTVYGTAKFGTGAVSKSFNLNLHCTMYGDLT